MKSRTSELNSSDSESLVPLTTVLGAHGTRAVRLGRSYKGIPVMGAEVVAQLDQNNSLVSATTGLNAPISLYTDPKISSGAALETSLHGFGHRYGSAETPRLSIDAMTRGGERVETPHLVWDILVHGTEADFGDTHLLVDASTGELGRTWSADNDAAAPGTR